MNLKSILIVIFFLLGFAVSAHTRKREEKGDYDVAVIGGGSGGISFSSAAKRQGLSVVLFDFVEPTIHGTKWGVGGTCANVGCTPKKLFHQAAILGQHIIDSSDYGWCVQKVERGKQKQLRTNFCWPDLVDRVNSYIRFNAWKYKLEFESSGIQYRNAFAIIVDKNTVLYSSDKSVIKKYVETGVMPEIKKNTDKEGVVTVKNIVIATGGKPTYLDIPGKQLAITSDDIFTLKCAPGKTLVIGGGYVAFEISGFLVEFGYNTSMMARSGYLRGFDRDMVKRIIGDLEQRKVRFIETSQPKELKKDGDQIVVTHCKTESPSECKTQKFETVIFAVGRNANTQWLNLGKLGIKTNPKNKKIITGKTEIECTGVPGIYAIGDVVDGVPELSGTVQKAGRFLAKRVAHRLGAKLLSDKEYNNTFIDFKDFPTAIFTPLEYGCCGLSEEKAAELLGQENIQVYHSEALSLQEGILSKYDSQGNDYRSNAYIKVITNREGKVYGLHYVGANAGQVIQGYAVALKMGLTKDDLDRTIGIHPTLSQQFVNVRVTKESGEDYQKQGCCG